MLDFQLPASFTAIALAGVLAALQMPVMAAVLLQPLRDEDILEVLPAVTRSRPALYATVPAAADAQAAVLQAREDISVARQTGDTR